MFSVLTRRHIYIDASLLSRAEGRRVPDREAPRSRLLPSAAATETRLTVKPGSRVHVVGGPRDFSDCSVIVL